MLGWQLPLVSVVIPTYNMGHFIEQAIDSVVEQTYANTEIIVVDDGSTDDTRSRLDRYRGRLHYCRQSNAGPSAARNTGIALASGDLIAFLDADDLWFPRKLEKQVAQFHCAPGQVLVYTDFARCSDPTAIELTEFQARPHTASNATFYELLRYNFLLTSSVLVRRDALMRAGGFDLRLRALEDRELWLRLASVGEFGRVNELQVVKRRHASSITRSRRFREYKVAAHRVIMRRWISDPQARRQLQRNLGTALLAVALEAWHRGDASAARRAYCEAARLGVRPVDSLLRAAVCCFPAPLRNWIRRYRSTAPEAGPQAGRRAASAATSTFGTSYALCERPGCFTSPAEVRSEGC